MMNFTDMNLLIIFHLMITKTKKDFKRVYFLKNWFIYIHEQFLGAFNETAI